MHFAQNVVALVYVHKTKRTQLFLIDEILAVFINFKIFISFY
jgi:hypothetical protein